MIRRLLCLTALIVVVAGCNEDVAHQPAYSEPAFTKLYRDAAATVIVSLSETNVATSGSIKLMVDVRAPADVPVEILDIHHQISPFTISQGYTEPIQTLPNGHLLRRRVWELAPGLPGTILFEPLEIAVVDRIIQTEPITITVTSVLPAGIEGVDIRDIAEPVILLPDQKKKRRSLYALLGSLCVLALIPLLLRLTKRSFAHSMPAPHEVALLSLGNLPADDTERVHELSHIFRAYYEARFGTSMLGQTAVELSPIIEDAKILRFLERCDDVRFSNKVPDGFAAEAEQFVRTHIEQTNEEAECA